MKVNWILYKPTSGILCGIKDEYPLFGKVDSIYIVNTNDVFFKLVGLSTIEFNEHRHLYVVEKTTETKTINVSTLYSPFPLHLWRTAINGL